jgi:enoyl-CoA hydratase/carnithine racemase
MPSMRWRRTPTVRVLVLTGAGKAFCAGLDLKELGAGQGTLGEGEQRRRPSRDPVEAIERFTGPVIGAINGAAVTGGFELALACDVLLASPAARFADTHARIGIAPGWGLSQKLSRAIGPYRAREVSFTGNWVGAEQAAAWGFVNRVVPAEDLLSTACAMARDMCSWSAFGGELQQVGLARVHHVAGVVVAVCDARQHLGRHVQLRQRPVAGAVGRAQVVAAAGHQHLEVRVAPQGPRQVGAGAGIAVALARSPRFQFQPWLTSPFSGW